MEAQQLPLYFPLSLPFIASSGGAPAKLSPQSAGNSGAALPDATAATAEIMKQYQSQFEKFSAQQLQLLQQLQVQSLYSGLALGAHPSATSSSNASDVPSAPQTGVQYANAICSPNTHATAVRHEFVRSFRKL